VECYDQKNNFTNNERKALRQKSFNSNQNSLKNSMNSNSGENNGKIDYRELQR